MNIFVWRGGNTLTNKNLNTLNIRKSPSTLHRLDTLKDVFTTTFGTLGLLRTAARARHLFRPGPRRRGAYCGHADSKLECVPNEVYCFGPFACLVLVGLGWLGSGRVGLV